MSTDLETNRAADELAALRASSGPLDPDDLDRLWPAFPTVTIPEILGRWHGVALDTGHRAVQQLTTMNWFGKEFLSASDAKPVLRYDDGNVYSDREAGAGEASLWMIEYRGEVTATMVYDGMAVFDHFKKVDDNTLLGIMNGKDPDLILDGGHHFYFILERV